MLLSFPLPEEIFLIISLQQRLWLARTSNSPSESCYSYQTDFALFNTLSHLLILFFFFNYEASETGLDLYFVVICVVYTGILYFIAHLFCIWSIMTSLCMLWSFCSGSLASRFRSVINWILIGTYLELS
jgi:hypothetical protein